MVKNNIADVVNIEISRDVSWLNKISLDAVDENDKRNTETKEINKKTKNRK